MNTAAPRSHALLAITALLLTFCTISALSQDVHVRVDPNGPGSVDSRTDYTTVQQALDHAPQAAAPYRTVIEIVPGTYHERIALTRNRPRITLLGLGKSPADVVITNSLNAKQAGGTFVTATADIEGDDFAADNITFENSAGNTGQAVAAAVRSDRAIFKHCRFVGDQDTLFADFGRQLYIDSHITGGVDFIFGNATAVFENDEIREIRPGYLTAQSRTSPDQTTGYVIDHSQVTRASCLGDIPECLAATPFTFFLGRPWRPFSRVVFMNTELPATLNPEGWSKWRKDDPTPTAFYAEYNNTGAGADTAERVSWSHQLTAKEAAIYAPETFLRGPDNWNPIAEAAKLP